MSDFGTRLRTLRKEKGITQLAPSQSLHVAQESISSYEHKGSIPSIEILISLAEFFDVSVDYLLGIDTKRKRISVQELDSFETSLLNNFRKLLPEEKSLVTKLLHIFATHSEEMNSAYKRK